MKLLSLVACLVFLSFNTVFAKTSHNTVEGETQATERPVDVDVNFNSSYFQSKPWVNEFHYVVVVNKANSGVDAQSINIYEFGKLIMTDKVSTGRDGFEAKGEHKSKRDSWSVTPTGYYTPTFIDKNHKSSAYGGIFSKVLGGVKMPYAVFFNGDIALHQAPKGTEGALGTKASGGCIRLTEGTAENLFNRVSEVNNTKIPKFNVDGTIATDVNGKYAYRTENGFSVLVVVINQVNL